MTKKLPGAALTAALLFPHAVHAAPASASARVEAANREALREPSPHGFVGAAQIYSYAEGGVYRLIAAPERVTDIALEPGEELIAVAAGDTARWTVGDTVSGAGALRRTHIMIKPLAPGLRTNLVITTDRRVYHLDLESGARAAMASVGWTYPADALLAIERGAAAAARSAPVADGLDPAALDFSYVIRGDDPVWRPLRAFDDGRQVFIEFPEAIARDVAPPLFVVGDNGAAELVNYRVAGRFYIVDRLFGVAELRQGEKKQTVVRICSSDRIGKARCKGKGK